MDFSTFIPQFGGAIWAVVFFVIALSVIVTIHELGHYLVGRWSGIGAEVFSVGFGPILFSRVDKHGTRWQVALLPLGGYVKFLGDANAASAPDAAMVRQMTPAERRRTMAGAPLWARAATVAAGPIFNFILAMLVFAGVMAWQGVPKEPLTIASVQTVATQTGGQGLLPGDVLLAVEGIDLTGDEIEVSRELPDQPLLTYTVERNGKKMDVEAPHLFLPVIGAVMPRSAAEDAGLKAGDVILSVDGAALSTFRQLQALTAASEGRAMVLTVWRDGAETEFTLVPRQTDMPTADGGFETRYLIGLTAGSSFTAETEFPGILASLGFGVTRTWEVVTSTLSGIVHMVRGDISTCNIQGPLGIAETSGSAASAGLITFVMFIGFLSAAVGLMNLVPVPVLDGGHLVFHAYEAITGRPPSDRAMQLLMSIGVALLAALMIFALTNDLRC